MARILVLTLSSAAPAQNSGYSSGSFELLSQSFSLREASSIVFYLFDYETVPIC